MARTKGALNKRPSKGEIDAYLLMLRQAAKGGDVQAATAVINFYAGNTKKPPAPPSEG